MTYYARAMPRQALLHAGPPLIAAADYDTIRRPA